MPHASTGAPSSMIDSTVRSSKSFDSTMPTSGSPAASSIVRARRASHAKSPESMRMAPSRSPRSRISSPTVMALRTPSSTS